MHGKDQDELQMRQFDFSCHLLKHVRDAYWIIGIRHQGLEHEQRKRISNHQFQRSWQENRQA